MEKSYNITNEKNLISKLKLINIISAIMYNKLRLIFILLIVNIFKFTISKKLLVGQKKYTIIYYFNYANYALCIEIFELLIYGYLIYLHHYYLLLLE